MTKVILTHGGKILLGLLWIYCLIIVSGFPDLPVFHWHGRPAIVSSAAGFTPHPISYSEVFEWVVVVSGKTEPVALQLEHINFGDGTLAVNLYPGVLAMHHGQPLSFNQ